MEFEKGGNDIKRIIYLLTVFCLLARPLQGVQAGNVELIKSYPLAQPLFVQGLEVAEGGRLVIGTGLTGKSKLGFFNFDTGQLEQVQELGPLYFGEGLTFTPDSLWQLTWQEKTAFRRDSLSLEILEKKSYATEGWGLCYDEDQKLLWRSDGTSHLYAHDPKTFDQVAKVTVKDQGKALDLLNELEYVDGYIYANRWYHEEIVKIKVQTMEVEDYFDLSALIDETLDEEARAQIDSLNGIAHIEANRFYVTGKHFPYIYEVNLLSQ